MIEVNVEILGVLRTPERGRRFRLSIPEGSSVSRMLNEMGFDETDRRFLLMAVNGKRAGMCSILSNGDVLTLSLPVGGG